MRKRIFIILIAIIGCLIYLIVRPINTMSTERNYDKFFYQYRNYSLPQLSELGKEYLLKHMPDSAIACYAMIATETEGKKDLPSLKILAQTYNTLGFLFLYEKGDNNSAYNYLLKSKELSEENAFDDLLSSVYLNIGNITVANDEHRALDMFRHSLEKSISNNNRALANIAFLNMVNIAMSLKNQDILKKILSQNPCTEESDSIALSQFTRLTAEGAEAFLNSDYEKAESFLQAASENIDTSLQPERYLLQALGNLVEVYRLSGNTAKLLVTLDRMEELCTRWNVNEMKLEVYRTRTDVLRQLGRNDEADTYDMKRHILSDTIYSYRRGYELKNVETQHEIGKMKTLMEEVDRISRTRLRIIICAVVMILLLMTFLFLIWHQKKRVDGLLLDLYARHKSVEEPDNKNISDSTTEAEEEYCLSSGDNEETTNLIDNSEINEIGKEKYKSIPLSDSEKTIYAERINRTLEQTAEVFSPGFNIDTLADLAGLPTKTVSRIINESFGMNFNVYVNQYRIREATRRLDSGKYDRLTIDVISEELGFRNRSHFAAVFKSTVGMSPSDFRRAAKLKRTTEKQE